MKGIHTELLKDGWLRADWEQFSLVAYLHPTEGPDSHAHSDQGHFSLFHDGQPLIVDPGRPSYVSTPETKYFVSASAHNAPSIAGLGTLAWNRDLYAKDYRGAGRTEIVDAGEDHCEIRFYGFDRFVPGVVFTRRFELGKAGLTVRDTLFGAAKQFKVITPFHFARHATLDGPVVKMDVLNMNVNVQDGRVDLMRGDPASSYGWMATEYGKKDCCTTVVVRQKSFLPIENEFKLCVE